MRAGVTTAEFGSGRPLYLIAMKVLFHRDCILGMLKLNHAGLPAENVWYQIFKGLFR